MTCEIDRLLRERQMSALRDRRAADRQPFVRPVKIDTCRQSPILGFTRDVSIRGTSIITSVPLSARTVAMLRFHSLFGDDVELRGEVRWCDEYGVGWFASGWLFLDALE